MRNESRAPEVTCLGQALPADRLLYMKAVLITRLGGPEVLQVEEVPDPVPIHGAELVRVAAAGVNFADIMTAQGGYPGAPKPPLAAGREFCGTLESNGQRVMGYTQWAAFAELVAARPENCCGRFRRAGVPRREPPSP